jgi:hypothetical protein
MRVTMQTCCPMQRISSSLRYVNCGPDHKQCIYSSIYIFFNIRWNASALLLEIIGYFEARYTANLVPNAAHIPQLSLCEQWSRTYTKCLQLHIYMLNIRWNASALPLEIIGYFEARYTENLEANIALIIRFTLCGLWSRTYTM